MALQIEPPFQRWNSQDCRESVPAAVRTGGCTAAEKLPWRQQLLRISPPQHSAPWLQRLRCGHLLPLGCCAASAIQTSDCLAAPESRDGKIGGFQYSSCFFIHTWWALT